MEIRLTKDAEYMVCLLYKVYKERRKNGIPKSNAKRIEGSNYIRNELLKDWSIEDIDETLYELKRANFLTCHSADDMVYIAFLNDEAIIYMENRFVDGLTGVLEYMAKIKSAITPF